MQIELVKLLPICHSEMDKVVSENASVRYSLLLNAPTVLCFETSRLFEVINYICFFFFSFN